MNRLSLYWHTVKALKPGQIVNRIRVRLGGGCALGVLPPAYKGNIRLLESPETLDFDPAFLARFSAEELMEDRVTLLHSGKDIDWTSGWRADDRSALWNYNLHYFEYLFPLVKAWKDTGDRRYLDKTEEIIGGWIEGNPEGTLPGWAAYPTALRIVAWISYYRYAAEALPEDFTARFLESLHAQYRHLSGHLEKDILGNHYFEDLKSLAFAALFFRDDAVLEKALADFKGECAEQILPDGMHFELSPMYHKIILEGVLRLAAALRSAGRPEEEIEARLQPMLDAACSFEGGLARIPLFNDGGANVAKSLSALTETAERYFGLKPCPRNRLEDSGFCFFDGTCGGSRWKLIVDMGQPGPAYIPGHAHCDAMSYELFCDGEPVAVNCGTYAYQCRERSFFRSTAAHNTVMINGKEQSQCWGAFRLAKRSRIKVRRLTENAVVMELTDAYGQKCVRTIRFLPDRVVVRDEAPGARLDVFVHLALPAKLRGSGREEVSKQPYSPEYGIMQEVVCHRFSGMDSVTHTIELTRQNWENRDEAVVSHGE